MEWKDTNDWDLITAKEIIVIKEAPNFEGERKGVEIEWDQNKIVKKADPASYSWKRP
jgi:hypothetical protein